MRLDPLAEVGIGMLMAVGVGGGQQVVKLERRADRREGNEHDREQNREPGGAASVVVEQRG